jgi:microcystin-dependent protein
MGTPYMGEIKLVSFNFAPQGWAFCTGQFLLINQNQALFSLLGTMYGGNGQTNFALPDLRGRVALHQGSGFTMGQAGGENSHTVILSEMPAHNHFLQADGVTAATSNANVPVANNWIGQTIGVPSQGSNFPVQIYSTTSPNNQMAPQTVTNNGGSQPHENRQPYLGLNMVIALQGIFPSQS